MALDHIAFDLACVARYHLLGDAIVQLVSDQQCSKAALLGHTEAFSPKNISPNPATAAIRVLKNVDRRSSLRNRGEGCNAGKTYSGYNNLTARYINISRPLALS
jgi:hypothetical protein|tara:strand:+ start:131 stop:442 length:312 start_codon:yes stop_codon:yes gene_type:complete